MAHVEAEPSSMETPGAPRGELLTIEEVAARLRVPKSWIYERTRRGAIPHMKLGKYLRFEVGALERWLAGRDRARPLDRDTTPVAGGARGPAAHGRRVGRPPGGTGRARCGRDSARTGLTDVGRPAQD